MHSAMHTGDIEQALTACLVLFLFIRPNSMKVFNVFGPEEVSGATGTFSLSLVSHLIFITTL